MLGRVPAWYAAMLGVIRIGAVAMPAPNQLTPRDIAYRIRSADAAAAITDDLGAEKIDAIEDELPSLAHRISTNAASRDGWLDFEEIMAAAGDGETPASPTAKTDPMILFFTSGTVGYPKMVLHPASYGLGHVTTARLWHDLRPGDRHWTVSDTGWAKAAWGGLFGQLARAGDHRPGRPRQAGCRHHPVDRRRRRHHLVLRAADALPAARAGGHPRPRPLCLASLHERGRAAEPGGHPGVGGTGRVG